MAFRLFGIPVPLTGTRTRSARLARNQDPEASGDGNQAKTHPGRHKLLSCPLGNQILELIPQLGGVFEP